MHTRAMIAYVGRGIARPRYYANDHRRDVLDLAPVEMEIADARTAAPTLDAAGFTLVPHRSAVVDFADRAAVAATHPAEIVALVTALSGADLVLVSSPGIRRFSERSALSGTLDNSLRAPRRAPRAAAGALRALQRLAGAVGTPAGRAARGVRCAHGAPGGPHRSGCGVRCAR
jgi:hypothetical protein